MRSSEHKQLQLTREIHGAIARAVAIELARAEPRLAIPDSLPCRTCASRTNGLTKAEYKVVLLLAEGKTVAEAAEIRNRSLKTVKSQLASAKRKIGAKNSIHFGMLLATKFGIDHSACGSEA